MKRGDTTIGAYIRFHGLESAAFWMRHHGFEQDAEWLERAIAAQHGLSFVPAQGGELSI